MNRISDFSDYNSHDLASDESFQSYVFSKNHVDIKFWEWFIIQHPGKHADINDARELLTLLSFNRLTFPSIEKSMALTRLHSSIQSVPILSLQGMRFKSLSTIIKLLARRNEN